jgi:hypothetical protein
MTKPKIYRLSSDVGTYPEFNENLEFTKQHGNTSRKRVGLGPIAPG